MADSPTILVASADDALRTALRAAIEGAGWRCVAVAGARPALDAAGGAEVVVLDDRLEGDACALAGRLRAAESVSVLALTGPAPGDRARALTGGCDDAVSRPVEPAELVARLRILMARRTLAGRLEAVAAEQRELLELKRKLAALLVHDLRNPISAIQGNVDLVLDLVEEPDPMVGDCLHDIRELTVKALSLVADLLDVEELEAGLVRAQRAPARVAPCIDQAVLAHRRTMLARKLELTLEVDPALEFSFDAEMCSRLVENLLDNAVRYAPRAGHVAIFVGLDGDDLLIRVGNDGPPVPVVERERIFERYYRLEARRAGARANRGLGLYFCKLAAEAHGGSIAITGTEALPTLFEVRLPAG
jgi:signal transduction histidine kinase